MATAANLNTMKTYTKRPYSLAQFTMMRGTIDYSNASQFNFYESGYSFLIVLSRPKYIEKLADYDTEVANLLNLFCFILENEFRGLSGIEDVTSEALEFSDGINTIATLGKSVQQSNAEITMQFTERSGAAMTKFIEYYLKGCKAPRTQAKTYHGLIAGGLMAGGFENEVFNLLYLVSDNTLLGLEKAYLFVNAWPNKAPTSIYESEKGTIEMKQIDVTFTCFVMDGEEVNRRALKMLTYINEPGTVARYTAINGSTTYAKATAEGVTTNSDYPVHPDSNDYNYQGYGLIDPASYKQREQIMYSGGGSQVRQAGTVNN